MRAATPILPGEDAVERDRQRHSLYRNLRPVGHLEESLVDTVHATLWTLDRCRLQEVAALSARVADAEARFERDCDETFQRHWGRLQLGKPDALFALFDSLEGVQKVKARWERLGNLLETEGTWDRHAFEEALTLYGTDGERMLTNAWVLQVAAAFVAARPVPEDDPRRDRGAAGERRDPEKLLSL